MVSIIILSYNTKDLLKVCLESIYQHVNDINFEVIVVDNASGDGSAQMVKNIFKKAILIENRQNFGFSKAINGASSKASGNMLLFLNSDTKLLDSNLKNMIEFLKKNEKNAIVGGNLVSKNSTSKSFGRFYNVLDCLLMLFAGKISQESTIDEVRRVDWVSGGYMLIKKNVFENLQGFDEHFFMYLEDMELCFRAHKAGFKTHYYPFARAEHIGQGSSNREFAIVQIYKGLLYFYKKHKTVPEYYTVKLFLILKAYLAIYVGTLFGKKYLVSTYTKALSF